MKTRLIRRDPVQGLDLTEADHGRAVSLLSNAQNCVLTNDKGTKRLGFDLFNTRTLTRGMMMQRKSYEGAFLHLNASAPGGARISKVDYPSLGYGFLRWHNDYQPKRGSDHSLDFRMFTGNFDGGHFWAFLSNAADRGVTQWTDVRAAWNIYLDTSDKLNISVTREDAVSTTQTLVSTTTFVKNTDYHIGLRYTTSTSTLQLYVNGVLDATSLVLAWAGSEVWAGESSAASYPNWYWLNQLFVHREMASAADDTIAGNPKDHFVEYPNHLEFAPENGAVYEIRVWSASKNYADAAYPLNRPLTAAEIADANLKGYWPCDDGGGGSFRNAKQANSTRPILCLPNTPVYVADTGLSSGLGLEFAEGTSLTKRFRAEATKVDALGLALWRLFGDQGIPAVSGANTRFAGLTVQFQIRTCFSAVRRPGNPVHQGYVFSVDIADTDNYFKRSVTPTFAMLLDEQQRLTATDIAGNVALTDETVYTVTYTRSVTGATAIYLNANTATSATGSMTAAPAAHGQPVSVNIGPAQPWSHGRAATGRAAAFRLGWLRIWRRELTPAERTGYALRRLTAQERADADMLVNLEVNAITGDDIPSVCSYPSTFKLAQVVNQDHLGPNGWNGSGNPVIGPEWWDSWANSRPVFSGNHDQTRTYDPVGAEGVCEMVTAHKGVFSGQAQMATVNHGTFHIDANADRNWEAVVPEDVAGAREYGPHALWDRFRALPAADRLFLLSDRAGAKVWTGRVLSPLGIPLPYSARLAESDTLPFVAQSSIGGQMEGQKYYSYMIEYLDDEFQVVERMGPTKAVQTSGGLGATSSLFIGAGAAVGVAEDDQRPIRRHLNPRVTSINLYRSIGSDTAALAEAGPFLFRSKQLNQDTAGTDTTADAALLRNILIDNLERPPLALYADIVGDQLVLAGLATARDSYLASDLIQGSLENFDTTTIKETEDGTGGVITGLKTAYGSGWLFKERSIWKLDSTDGGIVSQLYTASVGCIAPNSIAEFYAPSSGQRVIFFWSSEGPYIFDGTQPRYIGLPLKGDPNVEPFIDIADVSKIYVRNVEKYGQLWVFVPPVNRAAYEQVFAFDYLKGRWILHTGMRFNDMASVTLATNALPSYIAGGQRGKYYEVLESARDGAPAGVTSVAGTDIHAGSTTTLLKLTGAHVDWLLDLRDLVVTIIHANGAQERRWITSSTSDGFNASLVPEEPFATAPAPGDTWLVAGIDFRLLYPNDDLDDPTVDKHAHNLITYSRGALFYRLAVDWAQPSGALVAVAVTNEERIRTYVNVFGEVLKLELSNPLPDSSCSVHAYGYEVAPTRAPVRAE